MNPSPLKTTAPPIPPASVGCPVRAFLGGKEGLDFLRSVVRRKARTPDEVEELAAIAAVHVLSLAHRYRDEGDNKGLRGWVAVVARNVTATARARGRYREGRVVSGETREDGREGAIDRAPGEALGETDPLLRSRIRAFLARLPAGMVAAWWAVEIRGLTCEEAARELGCAVGTVMSRACRIRARLREEFAD